MKDSVRNKINELFNMTSKNVNVSWGKKNVGGEFIGDDCFIFMVEKKKPLNELSENEILPTSIDINGVIYKTDVRNSGKIKTMYCPEDVIDSCYDWMVTNPINQDVTRPLKGGVSISSINTIESVGTMGIIAVDIETNSMVGVTNTHVQVRDILFTNERKIGSEDSSEGNLSFQPGEVSVVDINKDVIGQIIRYSPISLLKANRTDGALISLNEKDISTLESFKQCGLSYDLPMPFASSTEIDELLLTNPKIYNSGRTSGPKENTPCDLMVTSIEAMIYVSGYGLNNDDVVVFENVICFERTNTNCDNPIASGDSGSALIADFDGDWKIIGLVFAGGSNIGYACRIDVVSQDLGITYWDGTPKSYINVNDYEKITVTGGSGDVSVICNDKKYWQIGSTFETFSC